MFEVTLRGQKGWQAENVQAVQAAIKKFPLSEGILGIAVRSILPLSELGRFPRCRRKTNN